MLKLAGNKFAWSILVALSGIALWADPRDPSTQTQIDPSILAAALTRIQSISQVDAAREAARLQPESNSTSADGILAAKFLRAVALERAADLNGAISLYDELAKLPRGTPFCESALFRRGFVDNSTKSQPEQEKYLTRVLAESDARGWFQMADEWDWTTRRRAAQRALVDLRSHRPSFTILEFLRTRSPWKGSMSFLGVLLALGIGAKILELPLLVKAAQTQGKLEALQPQIKELESIYSNDHAELGRQLLSLYRRHKLNLGSSFMMMVADLIFVVWALVTLNDFAPQMALDRSSLWWIMDVTTPSAGLILLWLFTSVLCTAVNAQTGQKGKTIASSIFGGILFCAIAYFWKWPAYVMIFWTLLTAVGLVMSILLWPVRKAAASSAY